MCLPCYMRAGLRFRKLDEDGQGLLLLLATVTPNAQKRLRPKVSMKSTKTAIALECPTKIIVIVCGKLHDSMIRMFLVSNALASAERKGLIGFEDVAQRYRFVG